jgi:predicted dehydrogenase
LTELPGLAVHCYAGGIFHDCAVHDIDIMCWVLGEYPLRVTAHVYAHTPEIAAIGDHDTVAVVLSFPSGTLGMIDLSRNCTYGYDQRLEVGPLNCSRNEMGNTSCTPSFGDGLMTVQPMYMCQSTAT